MKRTINFTALILTVLAFSLHAAEQTAFTGAGVVESTTGGFKFPDGSLQTTATESDINARVAELEALVVEIQGESICPCDFHAAADWGGWVLPLCRGLRWDDGIEYSLELVNYSGGNGLNPELLVDTQSNYCQTSNVTGTFTESGVLSENELQICLLDLDEAARKLGLSGGCDESSISATPVSELTNGGFETYTTGGFDPPTDWLTFGLDVLSGSPVGYQQYGTQAHNSPIYNPSDPGDVSNLYSGFMNSRGLKMWGRGLDTGGGQLKHTLGTLFQEFSGGSVPAGSTLTLTGWAYVPSVDPLGADVNAYLVIKCYPNNFSEEYCGGGNGMKSEAVTSTTIEDAWIKLSVTVDSLNAAATVIQAGIEFEQCASGPCTLVEGKGSVYWDEILFYWE